MCYRNWKSSLHVSIWLVLIRFLKIIRCRLPELSIYKGRLKSKKQPAQPIFLAEPLIPTAAPSSLSWERARERATSRKACYLGDLGVGKDYRNSGNALSPALVGYVPQGTHAVDWSFRRHGEGVRTAHTLHAGYGLLYGCEPISDDPKVGWVAKPNVFRQLSSLCWVFNLTYACWQ